MMMKKILVMIAAALMMASCSSNNEHVVNAETNNEACELVTLTFRGESHEYLRSATHYGYSVYAHWEGCKYCKNDSVK